ncbi:MAG: hypothetical protein JXB47_19905 [Anaerolineae bacterium]|nr:hypothetical protein [Anaerolineae bacterium]
MSDEPKPAGDKRSTARAGSVGIAGAEFGDQTQVVGRDLHAAGDLTANIRVNEGNVVEWVAHLAQQIDAIDQAIDAIQDQAGDAVRVSKAVSDMVSYNIAPASREMRKVVYGNGEEGLLQRMFNLEKQIGALREEVAALKTQVSRLFWTVLASPLLTILFLRFLGVVKREDD